MNSDELREKAIELMGRALDDLNRNTILGDSSVDLLVQAIDTILDLILDLILENGFELPTDVQGFIREGKPLEPLQ
jgi:hypothetical protein